MRRDDYLAERTRSYAMRNTLPLGTHVRLTRDVPHFTADHDAWRAGTTGVVEGYSNVGDRGIEARLRLPSGAWLVVSAGALERA